MFILFNFITYRLTFVHLVFSLVPTLGAEGTWRSWKGRHQLRFCSPSRCARWLRRWWRPRCSLSWEEQLVWSGWSRTLCSQQSRGCGSNPCICSRWCTVQPLQSSKWLLRRSSWYFKRLRSGPAGCTLSQIVAQPTVAFAQKLHKHDLEQLGHWFVFFQVLQHQVFRQWGTLFRLIYWSWLQHSG